MFSTDPETLAAFINAVAPSLIGGLLALTGVVGLFYLQQSAQRRADKKTRRDAAAERLMETLEAARDAYSLKAHWTRSESYADMLAKSWRFAWLLDKRERPVADWAWGMLFQTINDTRGGSRRNRDEAMLRMFATVMNRLNDWRVGSKRIKWFREDLARIQQSEPDQLPVPPRVGDQHGLQEA